MTDQLFISCAGHRGLRSRLWVPQAGAWIAELDLDESVSLSGRVEVGLGELSLSGTVVPGSSGSFALSSRVRVIAGGGGWGQTVSAQHYHNDAGVKARTVAEDASRLVGETLGTFLPSSERLGADYTRRICQASRVLEDAAGDVGWWVDYAGVTQVGPRAASAASGYELLEYDPRNRVAVLAVDDPGSVQVGQTLTDERLDAVQTVRELELEISPERVRMRCWTGGGESDRGRLVRALEAIARRSTDRQLLGKYRYRVFNMAAEGRVNLQAVRKLAGLPDVLPISIWPGVPGAKAIPDVGSEVLVEFIEGDPALPVVTAFISTTAGDAAEVAYKGATVKVLTPPAVFSGTINGAPASGAVVWPSAYTLGTIEVGTSRLKVRPG